MKAISWFSGIGGMDLAWTRAGGEIVGTCELDEHRRAIYAKHFGTPAWFERDAFELHVPPPPDADIWFAGHAVAYIERLVKEELTLYTSPPAWLWFETMLEAHVETLVTAPLRWLGYDCNLSAFDSHDFGLNETRTRLNIIANRKGVDCSWLHARGRSPWPTIRCEPGVMSYATAEDAEVAQGFPRGWTAIEGVPDMARRQALSSSVAIPAAHWVAKRLLQEMIAQR